VGKSTLVGKLSSAQPQIAEYPFTTKQIYIGLYTDPYGSPFFQVIDTPGVLDRPMEQRNVIERQAILALNTIASVILFIIDPTMTSGYELSHQIQLYQELTHSSIAGMNIPFKIVINKIDLATPDELNTALDSLQLSKSDVFLIDAKEGQNVTEIQDFLLKYFKETNFRR
jgi:nucleolar GTP-binding protein